MVSTHRHSSRCRSTYVLLPASHLRSSLLSLHSSPVQAAHSLLSGSLPCHPSQASVCPSALHHTFQCAACPLLSFRSLLYPPPRLVSTPSAYLRLPSG